FYHKNVEALKLFIKVGYRPSDLFLSSLLDFAVSADGTSVEGWPTISTLIDLVKFFDDQAVDLRVADRVYLKQPAHIKDRMLSPLKRKKTSFTAYCPTLVRLVAGALPQEVLEKLQSITKAEKQIKSVIRRALIESQVAPLFALETPEALAERNAFAAQLS